MIKGEAERIYRSIFKKKIPSIVEERFVHASRRIEESATEPELERFRKIITAVSDLAAAEYASRVRGKNPMLVKKFQVMVHLGECMPENYHIFINEKKSVIQTVLILAILPFNSVYKFLKGALLLKLKVR